MLYCPDNLENINSKQKGKSIGHTGQNDHHIQHPQEKSRGKEIMRGKFEAQYRIYLDRINLCTILKSSRKHNY